MASDGSDSVGIAAGGDTVSLRDDAMLVPGGAGHLILAGSPPTSGIAVASSGNTSLHGGGFGLASDGGSLGAAAGLVFAHGSVGAADLIPLAAIPPEAAGAAPLPVPVPVGGQWSLLTLADNTQLLFTTIGSHSGG
jgi:hypothetical protein